MRVMSSWLNDTSFVDSILFELRCEGPGIPDCRIDAKVRCGAARDLWYQIIFHLTDGSMRLEELGPIFVDYLRPSAFRERLKDALRQRLLASEAEQETVGEPMSTEYARKFDA